MRYLKFPGMNAMRIVLLAAVILVLCGCASSGTKIDAAQLDAIRKGQTTIDDIVRKFGRPNFCFEELGRHPDGGLCEFGGTI